MISGLRDDAIIFCPSGRLPTAEVAMYVWGHRQLNAMPASPYSAAQPSDSSDMPYLDNVYTGCAPSHRGFMFSGGEIVSTCGLADLRRCGTHAWVSRKV